MSKMSKKKEEDKITIAKLYETLRSADFLKSLFWDVLSDLHEKPTFKKMKETLKEILNRNLEVLSVNKCNSEVDKNYIVSTLCSLAFTTDAVYSKILFKQLDKEFNSQILKIINELRREGDISDDVWAELEIPNTNFDEDVKGAANSTKQKTVVSKKTASPTSTPKKQSPEKRNSKEIDVVGDVSSSSDENLETQIKTEPVSVRKGKQKITYNEDKLKNKKDESKNNTRKTKELPPQSKMGTRSHSVSKKTAPHVATFSPDKKLPGKSNSINEEIKAEVAAVNLLLRESQDSDTDSIISVGNISLASVSSVHTSDLSSFDDEVSLSSGDEGERRRVSLKDLVEKKVSGKFNGFKTKTQKSEENHCSSSPESSEVKASVQPTDKAAESATSEPLSPSHSSKRIRKPNSKYSSDTIICQSVKVKERKKSNVPATNTNERSNENSPKRKRTSDTEVETPSKVQKVVTVKENNSTNDKKPTKENQSSNMLKPTPSVRTLTSRRTAPLTLFSSKP